MDNVRLFLSQERMRQGRFNDPRLPAFDISISIDNLMLMKPIDIFSLDLISAPVLFVHLCEVVHPIADMGEISAWGEVLLPVRFFP